ncbi:arylcarboxylate reductase [Streptomyces lasalocidi]
MCCAGDFDPQSGSPYWLSRLPELSFDPLEITGYDGLVAFGPFPLEVLRSQDPAQMVPQSVPRPLRGKIWETGGTTGSPCRVFHTKNMLDHRAAYRRRLWESGGFAADRAWLHAGPSGPHLFGHSAYELADHFASVVYTIDMDPRWVKRMTRAGRAGDAAEYTDHLIEQIADVLGTFHVDYLSTTAALLQFLIGKRPDLVAELGGVTLTGTHITPDMYRGFVAALDGGLVQYQYGNTLGNSGGLPARDDGDLMPCVPNYPQVNHDVVDIRDWRRVVPYGEVGQVRMTALHEDLFLPNILERDQAVRFDTQGSWPTDGVANVQPLHRLRATPEGIY